MNARFLSTITLASLLALPAAANEKGTKSTSLEPNLMGTYELIGVNNDSFAVLMNGMVVELKFDQNTMVNGSKITGATKGQATSPTAFLNNFSIGDRVTVKAKRAMNEKDNLAIAIDKATGDMQGRTGALGDTTGGMQQGEQGRIGSTDRGGAAQGGQGRIGSTDRGGQTGGQAGGQTGGQAGGQTGGQMGGRTGGQTGGQLGEQGMPTEERARAAERFPSNAVMIMAPVIGVDGDKLVVDVAGFAIDATLDNESKIGGQQITGGVTNKLKEFKAGQRVNLQIQREGLENKVVMIERLQNR